MGKNQGQKERRKKVTPWLTHAMFFLVGMLTALLVSFYFYQERITPEMAKVKSGQRRLVNSLLVYKEETGFETWGTGELKGIVSLKHGIEEFINNEKDKRLIKSVAVYFRDLNNGPWFGIDEDEKFYPGSLLKIPMLIGYLKRAESSPHLLREKIKFTGDEFTESYYIKPSMEIEIGKSYTIEELIYRMLVYSDNKAARQLFYLDKGASFFKVFSDLLPHYDFKSEVISIQIHEYASFFRILYNASYLNKDMSNTALNWLTELGFKDGIVSGVPSNVIVARKFGERGEGKNLQFHDCGIVYYPKRPYLLCIMSKGENMENLIHNVKDISQLVYQHVDMQSQRDNFR